MIGRLNLLSKTLPHATDVTKLIVLCHFYVYIWEEHVLRTRAYSHTDKKNPYLPATKRFTLTVSRLNEDSVLHLQENTSYTHLSLNKPANTEIY